MRSDRASHRASSCFELSQDAARGVFFLSIMSRAPRSVIVPLESGRVVPARAVYGVSLRFSFPIESNVAVANISKFVSIGVYREVFGRAPFFLACSLANLNRSA
jgi:hypothetical protein